MMENDKLNDEIQTPEKRYFYYLESGTGEVSIVLGESRESIAAGAWWIPEIGQTACLDSSIFTDLKKLKHVARELVSNLKARTTRIESNYKKSVALLAELPIVK